MQHEIALGGLAGEECNDDMVGPIGRQQDPTRASRLQPSQQCLALRSDLSRGYRFAILQDDER
jgi:hypothetical protein